MFKQLIRRYLPEPARLRRYKSLQVFGERLHDPNLWYLNRRSVAGGLALGIFVAFIPAPGQMIIAAALSMWLRVNLPLAVATVWITNPITMPPIFYFTYKVGTWMLSSWPFNIVFELSPTDDWLLHTIGGVGGALIVGSLATGLVCALLTYLIVRFIWRLYVIAEVRRRRRMAMTRMEKRS